MSVTPAQISDMSLQLQRLQDAQQHAGVTVAGASSIGTWLLGDESSKTAYESLLTQTNIAIGNLSGPQWTEVMTDQRTYEEWSDYAKSTYQTLQSVDADLSNWTFGGVVSATAAQTGADIKKDATIGLAIGAPILIAGIAIYLFLILGGRH